MSRRMRAVKRSWHLYVGKAIREPWPLGFISMEDTEIRGGQAGYPLTTSFTSFLPIDISPISSFLSRYPCHHYLVVQTLKYLSVIVHIRPITYVLNIPWIYSLIFIFTDTILIQATILYLSLSFLMTSHLTSMLSCFHSKLHIRPHYTPVSDFSMAFCYSQDGDQCP